MKTAYLSTHLGFSGLWSMVADDFAEPAVACLDSHRMMQVRRKVLGNAIKFSPPAGTGLGLAISHEIMTAHEGRMWADNSPAGGAISAMERARIAAVQAPTDTTL